MQIYFFNHELKNERKIKQLLGKSHLHDSLLTIMKEYPGGIGKTIVR